MDKSSGLFFQTFAKLYLLVELGLQICKTVIVLCYSQGRTRAFVWWGGGGTFVPPLCGSIRLKKRKYKSYFESYCLLLSIVAIKPFFYRLLQAWSA